MSTLLKDQDGIKTEVAIIIEHSASLEESNSKIGDFARALYSDNIENVAQDKKYAFKDWLAHVEYSLGVLAELFCKDLANSHDEESRRQANYWHKKLMTTEIPPIFCQLSAIAE